MGSDRHGLGPPWRLRRLGTWSSWRERSSVGRVRALRTPERRFSNLEGWPYEPRYVHVGDHGLRMHYIDEGPPDAQPVLLAHGEPTWGYLYRKMIPPLLGAGVRVVVPDLVGFGRSDKPSERDDYSYTNHVEWTGTFLEATGMSDAVLFGHDWGGLIFLVHVARQPERFAAVVAANTALLNPDIAIETVPPEVVAPFLSWLQWLQERDELWPSDVVGGDCPLNQTGHRLSRGEAAAYDAPYPDESYRAGARQFPLLVPLDDRDPPATMLREAWAGLERYDRPFVTAFADAEDVTRFCEPIFQARVPGAAGQPHATVHDAGHFLQEHRPQQLVDIILGVRAAGGGHN
jgi:haloalkane dehalogenase